MADAHTITKATEKQPISCMNWFWTLFAMGIPLVNIAFCLYWAFNRQAHPSKRNFAIAALIWMALWIAFYVVLIFGFGGLVSSIGDDITPSSHYSQEHDATPANGSTSTSV